MADFANTFEAAIPSLRKKMMTCFAVDGVSGGFRSVWESFKDVVNAVLIDFMTEPPLELAGERIKIAKSKSVYPDLEITMPDGLYAIDVKSGEEGRDPWYDIGRLDTYETKHFAKYKGE